MVDKNVIYKDIVIVGGGLTGCILLLALKQLNLNVCLIEQKPFVNLNEQYLDARTLALSQATEHVLQTLDIWDEVKQYVNPIDTIHISQAGRFGSAILNRKDEALGHTIEFSALQDAFLKHIDKQKIYAPYEVIDFDVRTTTLVIQNGEDTKYIKANLVVAADGAESIVRKFSGIQAKRKLYDHLALVTNVGLSRHHYNIAYERFTSEGPMALLPLKNLRSALIWSLKPEKANAMLKLPDDKFLAALQKAFGYRLGRFAKVGKRVVFPLQEVVTKPSYDCSVVFVGNACHTLHPVAGQGFNLGVRDVATLAQFIIQNGINQDFVRNYYEFRKSDHLMIKNFTDSLVNIFQSNVPHIKYVRGFGLLAFDNLQIFKNLVSYYAQGFSGMVPDLACKIPLDIEK